MTKFRKKPVVIEATQWFKNGDHPLDGGERFTSGEFKGELLEGKVVRYYRHPDVPGESLCEQCGKPHDVHGWIDTLEQGHRVCPGDWIITGVKGERYPVKPDIFAATYDPEPEPETAAAFKKGDRVEKISGSSWRGLVVGTYSTSLTPEGYCVESENEPGSVQNYPVKALRAAPEAGN